MIDFKIGLTRAFEIATQSPDPRTQIGAIIDCGPLLYGYNHFPYKPDHLTMEQMLQSPEKYKWVEHAERAAIYAAPKAGCCLEDATMYCTLAACLDCARAIYLSGIKRVFSHQMLYDRCPPRWKEEVDASIKMFGKVGVEYVLVNDILAVPPIRYDGEIFKLVQG